MINIPLLVSHAPNCHQPPTPPIPFPLRVALSAFFPVAPGIDGLHGERRAALLLATHVESSCVPTNSDHPCPRVTIFVSGEED